MRVLCVYPAFPKTYWGAEYSLPLVGRKALLPPLGLLTVAALLPKDWSIRLCDLNVRPLAPGELEWADVVFLSGMLIQRDSLHRVARTARALGKRVVAGGAYASTSPQALAPYVDCVVVGEAEDLMPSLVEALERGGRLPARLQASERPDVTRIPVPRFDLLDIEAYQSIGVQWSRGCPFNCEFCDIIEIFGRHPRTKSADQLCRELDAIYALGHRGAVFVVDDNFVGNKVEARRMLGPLARWMRAHGDPFGLYTEASLNLAVDDGLIDAMVEAGFNAVFLGIETPSEQALRETQKLQNTVLSPDAAVQKLITRGLDVMAGFIVGFDVDDEAAIARQREWIGRSPIPLAMVGILTALPGTQLERRLAREGRLLHDSEGDSFGRPNFQTRLDEVALLEDYAGLLGHLYSPREFFARASRSLELRPAGEGRFRRALPYALGCLSRSLVTQGVRSTYRSEYWRYLWRTVRRTPRRLGRAIALAINGEHMIRYTSEDVLPRLRRAIEDARTRVRVPRPAAELVPVLIPLRAGP
jgi:radical SAM superfamily enzyme YgiQ (UPF0313 family)